MILDAAARAPVGLLPVVAFLAVLVYFDSYKLVSLRAVVLTIVVGAAAAGLSLRRERCGARSAHDSTS